MRPAPRSRICGNERARDGGEPEDVGLEHRANFCVGGHLERRQNSESPRCSRGRRRHRPFGQTIDLVAFRILDRFRIRHVELKCVELTDMPRAFRELSASRRRPVAMTWCPRFAERKRQPASQTRRSAPVIRDRLLFHDVSSWLLLSNDVCYA